MKRLFLHLSPQWSVAAVMSVVVLTLGQILHVPIQLPTPVTLLFMAQAYLLPFVLIGVWIMLPLPFLIYRGVFKKAALRAAEQAGDALCFGIVVLLAFHIKLWVPLINPLTYDHCYEAIDRNFFFWLDPLIRWRGQWHSDWIDRLYFNLLIAMFTVSFIVHYLHGRREFRRVFLASLLLQAFGGVSYLVAPALGPFIYHEGVNAYSAYMQHIMFDIHRDILADGSLWLQNNTSKYIVNGLGAMPSLHVAVCFVFLYYAQRYSFWLACFYWPTSLWIAFEAMATRWHYGIDLIAGIILSYGCVCLADLWMDARETAAEPKPKSLAELGPLIEQEELEESS